MGAGAVGISTALHLLLRGWQVTLIDAKLPASETSYGNAGVISHGSLVPLNNPDLFKSLLAYSSNLHPAVRYDIPYCIRHAAWLGRFFNQAREPHALDNAAQLHQLIQQAGAEHQHLMQLAGNAQRYRETGWLKVFREDQANRTLDFEHRVLARHGVAMSTLGVAELRDLEPSLSPIFVGGLWIKDQGSVDNPAALLREYANYFTQSGGQFLQQKIHAILPDKSRYSVQCDDLRVEADAVVVAMGAWSKKILQPLGYQMPLINERGYHLHFALQEGVNISRAIHDVEGAYVMTPMEQGLRITSGVELNRQFARSNLAQIKLATKRVAEAIAIRQCLDDQSWRGSRPSFADAKPVIDEAPHHKGLWFAFGHGHLGFNTGPVTGKLLAQRMSEQSPDINLQGFRATRF